MFLCIPDLIECLLFIQQSQGLSFFFFHFQLSDYFPNPYANEEAARAANNGTSNISM